MKKFIKVKTISSYHVIRLEDIVSVSPFDGNKESENKSTIRVDKNDIKYFSTQSVEEISVLLNINS